MEKPIRVLILHTSIGHGIKITAENIAQCLEKNGGFEVRIADLYQVAPGPLVRLLQKIYYRITETFPFIWGILYSEVIATLTIPFRLLAASFRYKKIWRLIQGSRRDIVVSTETVPSGIVAYLKRKGWYKGCLVIAISDYHLHRFWLYDETDLYLCVTKEQVDELRALGVSSYKIALTGMIIAEKYLREISRDEAAKGFELNSNLPTVLVSGGARGLVASKHVVQELFKCRTPFQIAVVTGKNLELKEEMEKLSSTPGHKLHILGYINNMDVLMSAADLIISKPGGPTIAEAVAKGLPVVLTDAHPGHEMKNLQYLVRQKIAWYGKTSADVAELVDQILSGQIHPDQDRAYQTIIKPGGAVEVASALKNLRF